MPEMKNCHIDGRKTHHISLVTWHVGWHDNMTCQMANVQSHITCKSQGTCSILWYSCSSLPTLRIGFCGKKTVSREATINGWTKNSALRLMADIRDEGKALKNDDRRKDKTIQKAWQISQIEIKRTLKSLTLSYKEIFLILLATQVRPLCIWNSELCLLSLL